VRALALLLLLAGPAFADDLPPPVAVHADAEPRTVTVGQRVRYTIEVKVDAGYEVLFAQPTERLGDFDIVDFGDAPAVQKGASTVVTRWFTLVGWEPGHHLIPSPPIRYGRKGEPPADAKADDIGVTIDSLLEKTPAAADIRDIREPEPVPIDWRPYWLLGGGVAALLALALGVWTLLRRRGRPAPVVPPRPAHVIAAEALARLQARGLVQRGEFKEYYSALSDVVRTYLEQRFELRAPEMTTEEFLLTTARDGRLARAHRPLLADFLTESDLVKFARHLPALADAERAFQAAQRFVDETAAVPSPEDRRAAG